MKKHIALATITVASFIFTAGLVSAATLTSTKFVDTGKWDVKNVKEWDTTGNSMGGMQITAKFSDGIVETKTWRDGIGAVGTNWSLTMLDGYYGYNTWFEEVWWILSNNHKDEEGPYITSLFIDGLLGNTAFDVKLEDPYNDQNKKEYSPGSENGRPVVVDILNPDLYVAATYRTPVYVDGKFYEDLYQTITFDFLNSTNSAPGLLPQSSFRFYLDTDNVTPVPEPATMLLFGIGAMGIAAFRKRKTL